MGATEKGLERLFGTLQELRDRVAQLEREVAERSMRESEQRFRLMADNAPVMMWMSGPDTLCTFFNKPWLTFRGRSLDQEMGSGWTEGVHPDDLQPCLHTYISSFNARQKFKMRYRLKRADGEYAWILDTGIPQYLPDGTFAGYVGSCIDLTDHRRSGIPDSPGRIRLPGIGPPTSLTEREQQVLALVAEGKSTKEIAAILGISYKTADSHRSKIMEKLHVHETASLVRYAIRIGLIQP